MKIYIIAGEPSGDLLGAKLIKAIRDLEPEAKFRGIGGDYIKSQNVDSLFPISDISIMGFSEVIPHIRKIYRHIDNTINDIIDFAPDIIVTIDSPGFCKRVVKRLREQNYNDPKFIHYVAPTVWAYKPERAKAFAELFDHIMLLLPFEAPYFEKEGLHSTFVGHSILEEDILEGNREDFRNKYKVSEDETLLCVLAGSRKGELKKMLPIFKETIMMLSKEIKGLKVIFPTISTLLPVLETELSDLSVEHYVVDSKESKADAYAASDLALCKSGTISLELAMAKLPMVIAYKVSPVSAWMLRRMIHIKYVNLINILQNKEIIKECLQEDCNAKTLSSNLLDLYNNKENKSKQLNEIGKALDMLKPTDNIKPSEMAAKTVISCMV